ncbi:MAG: hypothetical protein AB8I08_30015 [Sandaracinaceae bacterium]
MGRRNSQGSLPGGGQTMELDAVVDQLEEIAPPPGGLGAGPPPLPPKKSSPLMYLLAVVVVLAMGGLGIVAGSFLLGTEEPSATAAPAEPEPVEPVAESATPEAEAAAPEAESAEGEPAPDVVQLEEVVFDE